MKRLFFGFQVLAPWPERLPSGRIVTEQARHLTFAFLGNQDEKIVQKKLPSLPLPPFKIGKTGFFDTCLFLPDRHPHVVAWHGRWMENNKEITHYYNTFMEWIADLPFHVEKREEWLCHATIARNPFDQRDWQKAFYPLPFFISHLHLYESLPELQYRPIWSLPFVLPFEEFEHTADIAFSIRGETLDQLFYNAFIALCWRFPTLLEFKPNKLEIENLDDIIIALNQSIGKADEQEGCPFKAISFHGEAVAKNNCLEWEMIVDV